MRNFRREYEHCVFYDLDLCHFVQMRNLCTPSEPSLAFFDLHTLVR